MLSRYDCMPYPCGSEHLGLLPHTVGESLHEKLSPWHSLRSRLNLSLQFGNSVNLELPLSAITCNYHEPLGKLFFFFPQMKLEFPFDPLDCSKLHGICLYHLDKSMHHPEKPPIATFHLPGGVCTVV